MTTDPTRRVVVREDIRELYRGAGRLIRAGETGDELRRETGPYGYGYAVSSRSVVRLDLDPEHEYDLPSRLLEVVP